MSAFVCHNKIPHIEWLKQQKDFSHHSGDLDSKAKVPPDSWFVEGCLSSLQMASFSLCPHMDLLGVCTRREKGEGNREGEGGGLRLLNVYSHHTTPEATIIISFSLDYFLRGPTSQYDPTLEMLLVCSLLDLERQRHVIYIDS